MGLREWARERVYYLAGLLVWTGPLYGYYSVGSPGRGYIPYIVCFFIAMTVHVLFTYAAVASYYYMAVRRRGLRWDDARVYYFVILVLFGSFMLGLAALYHPCDPVADEKCTLLLFIQHGVVPVVALMGVAGLVFAYLTLRYRIING